MTGVVCNVLSCGPRLLETSEGKIALSRLQRMVNYKMVEAGQKRSVKIGAKGLHLHIEHIN